VKTPGKIELSIGNGDQGSRETKAGKNTLRVQCLGELKVSSSTGKVQSWRNKSAKLMFEYLIAKRGAPVTREALIEMLWPDQAPEPAFNNLKVVVYRLRETLKPLFDTDKLPVVVYKEDRYVINPDIFLDLDFVAFERHWKHGKALESSGRLAEAITEYEQAVQLYLGDFLEEELYQEWTIQQREALKDFYMHILDKLAATAINSGDYEQCIEYCHKILAKDASIEDIYRRLMLCYSRLGQPGNALKCYERCSQVISAEMGIQVASETTALYNRIKNGHIL